MTQERASLENELLEQAATSGPLKKAIIYSRLSGPGWLQGAITLGGGSLAGSLYLGVLFGPHMLWLQPLAMVCGVVMLSAITYVTLSTGERPFGLVSRRISPVLAWAWLIAAGIANLVFCLPQFSLATAAIQQNLFPSAADLSPYLIGLIVFVVSALIVASYGRSGAGVRWFERILKIMVGIIVLAFVGVTATLVFNGAVDLGAIFQGFIPNFSYFNDPTPAFTEVIAQTGANAGAWTGIVTADHAGKIIAAFGTAVGINMTFLLPYSILKRQWGRRHRGLAIFDLAIGLIVPFVIATSCLVIASASQFYGKTSDVLDENGEPRAEMAASFGGKLNPILSQMVVEGRADTVEAARELLTPADRHIAAMLADRDVGQLAVALKPFTGRFLAQKIFGVGVLGMAVSTVIMLMLINGFVLSEALGCPENRTIHFLGALMPGILGVFHPAIWLGASKAALAIPAATIAGALIPIAYFTFLLLMNSKAALGVEMPSGGRRFFWNLLMILATGLVTFGVIWVTWQKTGVAGLEGNMAKGGLVLFAILFVVGLIGFLKRDRAATQQGEGL